jgi:hypothetical protein
MLLLPLLAGLILSACVDDIEPHLYDYEELKEIVVRVELIN